MTRFILFFYDQFYERFDVFFNKKISVENSHISALFRYIFFISFFLQHEKSEFNFCIRKALCYHKNIICRLIISYKGGLIMAVKKKKAATKKATKKKAAPKKKATKKKAAKRK